AGEHLQGAIHGNPDYDLPEDIRRSLVNERNPGILHARRMGKTRSAVMIFEGTRVPHYVYYRGAEYRCLHYKEHETGNTCGQLRHRADIRPSPNNKCSGCGAANLPEDHKCDPSCSREQPDTARSSAGTSTSSYSSGGQWQELLTLLPETAKRWRPVKLLDEIQVPVPVPVLAQIRIVNARTIIPWIPGEHRQRRQRQNTAQTQMTNYGSSSVQKTPPGPKGS
ncbi:hypothetical protein HPB47_017292, partial [Ixodes persulcatus]